MALPSAHRPSDVTSVTAGPSSSSLLTLKINKGQVFMNDMIEWYKNKLNRRQRSELTKKRVIRYATTVAYRLNVPYDNLPENWLRTLYEEHEVTFKFPKKRKEREEAKKKQDDLSMNIFERNVIDLTKEPPPPEWVTGYMTGTVKPRILKVYINSAGVMVVYYDYDAATVGSDGTCLDLKHIPYDRDGVFPPLESV